VTARTYRALDEMDPDVAVNPELSMLRALKRVATAAVPTMIMADPDVAHDADEPGLETLEPEQQVGRTIIALIKALVEAIAVYDTCLHAKGLRFEEGTK
jgi:hypothetical protein